ncbi:MAG TPA: pyridoxal-phosphate dependent enzyme, partial [Flavisolibacter sp.]|nr:pyridoxal-phosphate dependent enzyme [Flavisolibacter sp.]
PVVSGNKWFKLKRYLLDARQSGKNTLLTFGGAYSNHIAATAAAANEQRFRSIGIIRGEEPSPLSHTLAAAASAGMKLYFISREAYQRKTIPIKIYHENDKNELYVIPEGGYGNPGVDGASEILQIKDFASYTHIISAVGTGTTLAGLVTAAGPHQKVIGIPVLKNALSLQKEIDDLLPLVNHSSFQLLNDYHFSGYAKQSAELFHFMNRLFLQTGIPTDFVYTAKAFYAAFDLLEKGFFSTNDKILLLHTGGLQGNLSLPKGTLIFG